MEFNENGKREVYSFDLDGVLTNGEYFWKQEPTPYQDNIHILRELYKAGNIIIIWTAKDGEASEETAAFEFKANYGEDPRAIYSYINSVTGHTSFYIPKASCDMRQVR